MVFFRTGLIGLAALVGASGWAGVRAQEGLLPGYVPRSPAARGEAALLAQLLGSKAAPVLPSLAAPAVAPPTGFRTLRAAPVSDETRRALEPVAEAAALAHGLSVDFFKRLIRQESGYNPAAISPAGAQGIAQFMPATAATVGLDDPFDALKALPKSAEFLSTLRARLGNDGLAAAAYNAGEGRVRAWLAGRSGLPLETQLYVQAITGRDARDWAGPNAPGLFLGPPAAGSARTPVFARLQSPEWQLALKAMGANSRLASLLETAGGPSARRGRAVAPAARQEGGERALCQSLQGRGCLVATRY